MKEKMRRMRKESEVSQNSFLTWRRRAAASRRRSGCGWKGRSIPVVCPGGRRLSVEVFLLPVLFLSDKNLLLV